MVDESKASFRFKRPWETPPYEPESHPVVIKLEPQQEDSEEDVKANQLPPPLSMLPVNGYVHLQQQTDEAIEVFRFDRDNLVLTSEKVTVKRESEEFDETPLAGTSKQSMSPSSVTSPSSFQSNNGSNSSNCSSSDSSSSDSDSEDAQASESIDLKTGIKIECKVDPEDYCDDNYLSDDEKEGAYNLDSKASLKVRLEDFTEGRNKERKNSKWADYGVTRKSNRLLSSKTPFCNKAHRAQALKKLTLLLKKEPGDLIDDEKVSLNAFPELTLEARKRLEKRQIASERLKEEEDPEDLLEKKCVRLTSVIARAKYLVVYTGAGISTSALIPDYRGPNGIWTLLRKGQSLAEDLKQFPQSADPTLTHMAIKQLYEKGIIKHIVSQNVDGLHLRSGIPKTALSEVHGNMYIEVCLDCHREYVRLFDVTENTRRHHHKTGRFCYHCGCYLKDSVVLFGEKGSLRWPINWAGAEYHVDKADVILCIGSSLKVLRRYPWLWCMSKPAKQRPKLVIVNLQWTPKDRNASLKINGRCDEVITKVMDKLRIPIPLYKREEDAIFRIATPLHPSELFSKLSKELSFPENLAYPDKSKDLQNYFRFEPVFSKEVRSLNQAKRKIVDGEVEEETGICKPKSSCGIGWLGNAISMKPKKKKVK